MALDELRRNIEHQAKSEAAKLEKETDSECNSMIEAARKTALEIKKKAKDDAVAEAERRKKDSLTEIDMEASGMIASARGQSIEGALKQFDATVRKKLDSRQNEIIRSAMKRFSTVVQLDRSIITVSKRHHDLVKPSKAKIEYENISGIHLKSSDGRISADATVSGLMQSNADVIRRILSKGMFD